MATEQCPYCAQDVEINEEHGWDDSCPHCCAYFYAYYTENWNGDLVCHIEECDAARRFYVDCVADEIAEDLATRPIRRPGDALDIADVVRPTPMDTMRQVRHNMGYDRPLVLLLSFLELPMPHDRLQRMAGVAVTHINAKEANDAM